MRIVIVGAGVQGTLYGVRLALCGHDVTFVARGSRAEELRRDGAVIEDRVSGRVDRATIPVVDGLLPEMVADLCFVMVRREQLEDVLPSCRAAHGIARFVFMVNHANGSEPLSAALGRGRVVLGFPGAAGGIEHGVDRFAETVEQPTAIDARAPDVGAVLRFSGFRVQLIADMDAWLKRHAVFVTAICGALYEANCDVNRLSTEPRLVRDFILAVREGWSALDKLGVVAAPFALRVILCWVPLGFAVTYWRRYLKSPKGEHYFARHARHAPKEMAALAADVRALLPRAAMPRLRSLYAAIDRAADVRCAELSDR